MDFSPVVTEQEKERVSSLHVLSTKWQGTKQYFFSQVHTLENQMHFTYQQLRYFYEKEICRLLETCTFLIQ